MVLVLALTFGDTSRVVEVESCATLTNATALEEPAASEPALGVNSAVSCSGEVEAANEVVHAAVGLDGVIGSATQPPIELPWFLNVIVPDGEPEVAVTEANSVTGWLVTAADGAATIDVVVPVLVCVKVAVAASFAAASVAVIVA